MNASGGVGRAGWVMRQMLLRRLRSEFYNRNTGRLSDPDTIVLADERRYNDCYADDGNSRLASIRPSGRGYSSAVLHPTCGKVIAEDFCDEIRSQKGNLLARAAADNRHSGSGAGGSKSAKRLVKRELPLGTRQNMGARKGGVRRVRNRLPRSTS